MGDLLLVHVSVCKYEVSLFLLDTNMKDSYIYIVSGASDDAVSCAVMLEVLHSLANQSTPLLHGVVFLFNGAEENILQVKSTDKNV